MMHDMHSEMHAPVSARLTAFKRNLEESRHGGLRLTGDDLEAAIEEFRDLIRLTRQLEDAAPGVLRRAAAEQRAAEVLTLMHPGNVIAFDPRRQ